MYVEFKQSGNDITGRKLISGYFNKQNRLGERMFKYENGTASRLSGVSDASYYQPKRIVVGPRSGSRSKLTFDVKGTQTVPAVSGMGVELTFDANARGELATEFRKSLSAGDGWQTLTTEYELKDIEIRCGRIDGSWVADAEPDAIAFGWTNNNVHAGFQMQQFVAKAKSGKDLIRICDVELRQNGNAVEIKWVRSLYSYDSASTFYGKKYFTDADYEASSDKGNPNNGQVRVFWVSTKATAPAATVTANGANTMTDSAYVIRGDVNHPIDFKVAVKKALPNGATDAYGAANVYVTATGASYNSGVCDDSDITMHEGSALYQTGVYMFSCSQNKTLVLDGTTLTTQYNSNNTTYLCYLVMTNGATVSGSDLRAGYQTASKWRITGEGVCTANVNIEIVGNGSNRRELTFEVEDTAEGPDFILNGDTKQSGGSHTHGVFKKTGPGTMIMNGTIRNTNEATDIADGTLVLGKTGATVAGHSMKLTGGTLELAAGTSNTMATVSVTADSTLTVGSGASLTMANLTVSNDKTLSIECADGNGSKSVKVNTTLGADTLSKVRLNGHRVKQSSDGYLYVSGFVLIVR